MLAACGGSDEETLTTKQLPMKMQQLKPQVAEMLKNFIRKNVQAVTMQILAVE